MLLASMSSVEFESWLVGVTIVLLTIQPQVDSPLRSILLFAQMDVSECILELDTFVWATSNMARKLVVLLRMAAARLLSLEGLAVLCWQV